tara:strand:- start:128 stop:355 length:228 start_codon:yes stop_codon:yes gene_type:complete
MKATYYKYERFDLRFSFYYQLLEDHTANSITIKNSNGKCVGDIDNFKCSPYFLNNIRSGVYPEITEAEYLLAMIN